MKKPANTIGEKRISCKKYVLCKLLCDFINQEPVHSCCPQPSVCLWMFKCTGFKRKTVWVWYQSYQFPAAPLAASAVPGQPSCWPALADAVGNKTGPGCVTYSTNHIALCDFLGKCFSCYFGGFCLFCSRSSCSTKLMFSCAPKSVF